MIDVMQAVKERKAKAESKVARCEKALDSAKKELADVLAAERVIGEITGESPEPKSSDVSTSARDSAIARLLPSEKSSAISPAELYPIYTESSGDSINLESFRTAIWRLLKKTIQGSEMTWNVKSENGRYWREPVCDLSDERLSIWNGEDEDFEPSD